MRARSILIADDDEVTRDLVLATLAGDPFVLLVAADGVEALALARRAPVDLVVLDLLMPGLDGVEVCRALKADPATAAVPIIVLTALAQDSQRQRALGAGADAYLTKPFSPRALRELVRRLLPP